MPIMPVSAADRAVEIEKRPDWIEFVREARACLKKKSPSCLEKWVAEERTFLPEYPCPGIQKENDYISRRGYAECAIAGPLGVALLACLKRRPQRIGEDARLITPEGRFCNIKKTPTGWGFERVLMAP
jgi:hypothetical protein